MRPKQEGGSRPDDGRFCWGGAVGCSCRTGPESLGCGQPSKPVDSITDPRFAAEFAYARQIWLHSLKAQEAAIKLELPRLSAGVEPGWILQERKPTDLDRFVTEVTHLYHRGVAALASPHPGVVDARDRQRCEKIVTMIERRRCAPSSTS